MGKKCNYCQSQNDDNATDCITCDGTFLRLFQNTIDNSVSKETIAQNYQWLVTCPECGEEYQVANENETKDECDRHTSQQKRRKIKNERAQWKIPKKSSVPTNTKDTLVETQFCDEAVISESLMPTLVLTDVASGKTITISGSGVIGREGTFAPDYFVDNLEISRKHCIIKYDGGVYTIEHIGLNESKIGRVKLRQGVPAEIKSGQYLHIADLTFGVSIQ